LPPIGSLDARGRRLACVGVLFEKISITHHGRTVDDVRRFLASDAGFPFVVTRS